jgi:hypothetical protein
MRAGIIATEADAGESNPAAIFADNYREPESFEFLSLNSAILG